MSDRKVRSLEVMLRLARLSEARARHEAARARVEVQMAAGSLEVAEQRMDAATEARQRQVAGRRGLALGLYEGITAVVDACDVHLAQAQQALEQKEAVGLELAAGAAMAARMSEGLEDRIDLLRLQSRCRREVARGEAAIELWLGHRGPNG